MNKKLIHIAYFIASLFMLASCNDKFLEEKELYNSFNTNVFESEVQTSRFLAYIYFCSYGGYTTPIKTLFGTWSDDNTKMTEEIGGTIGDYINSNKILGSSNDGNKYFGGRLTESVANTPYTRIRNCNMIIENMAKYGNGKLTESFMMGVKGQAFFIRALQYFELMRIYGGVPLVTKVQNGVSLDESIKLPRASVAEMIQQLSTDLDSAAFNLPSNWASASADYGRPTKGAALAMKCRVLMTAASPLFNRDWDNVDNQLWKDALTAGLAAKAELTAAGYSLYGATASDWSKMFYTFNNQKCPEAIYTVLCDTSKTNSLLNGWESSIRLAAQGGGGGIIAPKEMIDLFPMADGSRPTAANGYDEFLFFKNRDPRFYRTFAFSGRKWPHKTTSASNAYASTVWAYNWMEVNTTGAVKTVKSHYSNGASESPAFVCKMSNLTADSTKFGYTGSDIYEYRFAELLLNIAECNAATGQIDECTKYLGQVRARVGIPAANNYGIGTLADKYAALEACLYERRVELAYEGKRFWDIKRWMLYNDDEAAGNNTCEKLRIPPINGTCRTGKYLMAIDTVKTTGTAAAIDPYLSLRATVTYNPDAANSTTQMDDLANFYTNHFKIVDLTLPIDRFNALTPAYIDWKQNYYISGLYTEVFTYNPWLIQTQGWTDNFGNAGTFSYR